MDMRKMLHSIPYVLALLALQYALTVIMTFVIFLLLGREWTIGLATAFFLFGLLISLFVNSGIKLDCGR